MSLIKPLRKLRRDVSLWDFIAMKKVCFLIAKNFKPLEQSRPVRPIARIGTRVVTFLYLGRFSASRSKRVDCAVRARAWVGHERAFIPEKRRSQGRTNGWMKGPGGRGTYEGYGGTFTQNSHYRHRQLFTIRALLSTLAPSSPPHS